MKNQTLVVVEPSEFGLEKTEAQKIESVFTPMLEKMIELEKEYNEIVVLPLENNTMKRARELRLKYVKVRTGTDKIHETAKAYYLAGGRFVDAWRNAQKFSAIGKEAELEKIEKHFELIEEQKREILNEERKNKLSQYIADISFYNLKDMSEQGFNELLNNSKVAFEARIEAEKKAEQLRIEKEKQEIEDRKRMKQENERLKAEAEAKEKEMIKERAEQEKQLALERAKAQAEAEAKARLQAELKAKEQAEIDKLKQENEAKKQAELAPDREKLLAYATELGCLEVPKLQTQEAKKILEKALTTLNQTILILKNQ